MFVGLVASSIFAAMPRSAECSQPRGISDGHPVWGRVTRLNKVPLMLEVVPCSPQDEANHVDRHSYTAESQDTGQCQQAP